MGGDDDLVGAVLRERVHRGRVGVGVHHLAVGLDAHLAQLRERGLEPVLGRGEREVVVDHVAVPGLVLRADDVEAEPALRRARACTASISARPPTVSLATTSTRLQRSPSLIPGSAGGCAPAAATAAGLRP